MPFQITRCGFPAATIVTADNPCEFVALAAEELQHFLAEVSGAILPIIPEAEADPNTPLILVGDSQRVRELGIDPSDADFEEFVLHSAENRLVLAGRDNPKGKNRASRPWFFREAGTLLAVHTFLQDYIGIRWYFPGPLGTVIRKKIRNLRVPYFSRAVKPAFFPRETLLSLGGAVPGGITDQDLLQWVRRTRHGGPWVYVGHSFWKIGEEYTITHPEYFAVDEKGGRAFFTNGIMRVHLCLSQPDLVDIFADLAKAHFDVDPGNLYYTILPGDSFRRYSCKCPDCLAQYDYDNPEIPEGAWQSRYVHSFLNKVAAKLKEDYPDRKLYCGGYDQYRWPFPGMTYEPNVAIGVTHNRIGFGYQPGTALEELSHWSGVVDTLFVDENYHAGMTSATEPGGIHVWEGAPRLCPHRIAGEIQGRVGIVRGDPYDILFPDGNSYQMWGIDNLNLYVTAQLNFDPHQDVDVLIDEYCQDLYGKGAEHVRAFYDLLEKRWTEMPTRLGIFDYKEARRILRGVALDTLWEKIYDTETVNVASRCLWAARNKTRGIERERVDLLMDHWDLVMNKRAEYLQRKGL